MVCEIRPAKDIKEKFGFSFQQKEEPDSLLTFKTTKQMKKLLVVFAIAGSLIACNNSSDTAESAKDSLDSVASEKKEMIDSSAEQKKDVVDSTTEQKKEAIDKMDSASKKSDSATKK
jgi:hypothetical protein